MPHILIVDGDEASMHHTRGLLEHERYHISQAEDARSAVRLFGQQAPDLVLLEALLPDSDGFDVCRRIRRTSDVPIMFYSTNDHVEQRVAGLETGADDFVSKYCPAPELLARVRAVLARAERARRLPMTEITSGPWTLDPQRQVCMIEGSRKVELTPRETHLLGLLLKRSGRVCTTTQIVRHVWSYAGRQARSIVATSVWRLRAKLEIDAQQPQHILTVRNVGYTFRP
ncbi:MAG TPA: response regulator transcription factor [Roseiflexaceae bacterium]|nr:response regulator transcription factor [Roseiflexaceae bacterium]